MRLFDEACLVARAKHGVLERGRAERAREARQGLAAAARMRALFDGDVRRGIAHEHGGPDQSDRHDRRRADPHHGAGRIGGGERAGREGGGSDAEIPRRLVEAEREAAPRRAGQVDLHDDGHRPGETLVDAEQHVGGDDERPRRRKADEHRDRHGDEPAEYQQPLASDAIGERPGSEVRDRLGETEGHHEGEDRRRRGELEVMLADQREDAPLESDHAADEGIEADEEGELCRVRTEAEGGNRAHRARRIADPRMAPCSQPGALVSKDASGA